MKKVIVTSAWGAGYPEGGGMQWLNLHYLAGFRALGIDAFWLDILNPPKPGANRTVGKRSKGSAPSVNGLNWGRIGRCSMTARRCSG